MRGRDCQAIDARILYLQGWLRIVQQGTIFSPLIFELGGIVDDAGL